MKKTFLTKLIAIIAVIALVAGVMSGCGKKVNDKDEEGRTIISVNEYPDKEGPERDAYDLKIEKFEADNPDVKVNPDMWKFEIQTFYAKAAGNQLPNVFRTYFTEAGQCRNSGYSTDITDALDKHGYKVLLNEKVSDVVTEEGRIYGLPINPYLLCLAFNTEMLEAAGLMEADGTPKQPKTWDEVVEFAKKIKDATGKPGFAFPTAETTGGWIFTNLAWSFGVDFMEQDANGKWKATFNSPEAEAALQWVKDLKWKHDIIPSNTLLNHNEYHKTFATGGAAMIVTPGDVPRKVVQYGMTPEQLGMMALPAGPARHVTLLGGSVLQVASSSTEDQVDAAVRWIGSLHGHQLTEAAKAELDADIDKKITENWLIGPKTLNAWKDSTERVAYQNELIDKNTNANPNHYRLYNEFLESDVEVQPEEPVCAQDLYRTLDNCIQEVLTNKDADCAQVLEKACADFQANYLDNLTY